MDLLLGLDVGTTATKSLLVDLDGDVVASATHHYGLITPQERWVEQDPEALWCGVVETCRAVLQQIAPGDRVVALSQSSQGGTTIPVDADDRPTYNAISWMDQRAAEQARRVRTSRGAAWLKRRTGWALSDGLPLQHVAWLREHRPDVFAATRHVLFVNDFITHRLTGRLCTNPSDAGITQLMDLATGDWDERLLAIAGIARSQLSPIRPSGAAAGPLTASASQATGLPQDVLVANGAHDQYCAAVGTGATRPGVVLLSCGTAWVLLAVPEGRKAGLRSGLSVSRHAVEKTWGAIRSLGGVGTSLEWVLDHLWRSSSTRGERRDLYDAVNREAAQSPAGANGLLFYPLSGGHAADHAGRGGLVGLSLPHSRGDLARAAMEGVALELRWAMDEMQARGIRVAEFKMVGGAAESTVWPQIVADVTGVPVALPTVRQAAARGAAILAGVGAGLFASPEAGLAAFRRLEVHLDPGAGNHSLYDDVFARYKKTWKAVFK